MKGSMNDIWETRIRKEKVQKMSDIENKGVSPLEGEGLRGDGKAKWYVVHTYSGHENKVKVNIEKMVENRGMQNLIIDIVVPTEDRVEIKDGQRKIKTKKCFRVM